MKNPYLMWEGRDSRQSPPPTTLIEVPELSYGDVSSDNRLIHGDNLLALKALEQEFTGKIKCVYIDPPYNTGSAFEHYDDGLEHSLWLSLMRDRLELLAKLLRDDGSIWISIDDNEAHYLKVLCDEIFGRANFVANIIWEKRTTRENRRVFSFNHDHVLVYAKVKSAFEAVRNPLPLNQTVLDRYKNPDNDPRGPWQSVSANAQAGHATASQFYDLIAPSGVKHRPPEGRCWLYTQERMRAEIAKNNIWFGKDGKSAPRIKKFLRDAQAEDAGLTPETLWKSDDVGTNDSAKKHLLQVFDGESRFDTPKPEELIARIVEIASNSGDLILDSFLGSGTTAAVAHKLGRRWIGIELGEHANSLCATRMRKVIDGSDPGGITEAVDWKGGGGFRFFRVDQMNTTNISSTAPVSTDITLHRRPDTVSTHQTTGTVCVRTCPTLSQVRTDSAAEVDAFLLDLGEDAFAAMEAADAAVEERRKEAKASEDADWIYGLENEELVGIVEQRTAQTQRTSGEVRLRFIPIAPKQQDPDTR